MATIVLTGATSGIGRAAYKRLTAEGHDVVGVGRTEGADERVDLGSLDAIRALAGRLPDRIDVLCHNAGVVSDGHKRSADGFELTFAVNHLAPYVLTRALGDRVAHVVTTSSDAHKSAVVDLNDPGAPGSFWNAYCRSKLCNVLFTRELARRGMRANCFHPGVIRSGLAREAGPVRSLAWRVGGLFMASPASGADTLVWLATAPEADVGSGGYFAKRGRVRLGGQASDDHAAAELWRKTEELLA